MVGIQGGPDLREVNAIDTLAPMHHHAAVKVVGRVRELTSLQRPYMLSAACNARAASIKIYQQRSRDCNIYIEVGANQEWI